MSTNALIVVAAAAISISPSVGYAQEKASERVGSLFLDQQYVSVQFPTGNQLFEAQIGPHLFINSAGDFSGWRSVKHEWIKTVVITPMVRLRMLKEESAPVRTPSYMPKLDAQLIHIDTTSNVHPWLGKGAGLLQVTLTNFALTVGHHSNGQDGCLFTEQTVVEKTCQYVGARPQMPTVNRKDGSFSTDYVRATVDRTWLTAPSAKMDAERQATSSGKRLSSNLRSAGERSVSLGAFVEVHPVLNGYGGLSTEQWEWFGRARLDVHGSYTSVSRFLWRNSAPGLFHISVAGRVRDRTHPDVSKLSIDAQTGFTFDPHGMGFFLRYYHGQDYYNLGYATQIQTGQIGVRFESGRFRGR